MDTTDLHQWIHFIIAIDNKTVVGIRWWRYHQKFTRKNVRKMNQQNQFQNEKASKWKGVEKNDKWKRKIFREWIRNGYQSQWWQFDLFHFAQMNTNEIYLNRNEFSFARTLFLFVSFFTFFFCFVRDFRLFPLMRAYQRGYIRKCDFVSLFFLALNLKQIFFSSFSFEWKYSHEWFWSHFFYFLVETGW